MRHRGSGGRKPDINSHALDSRQLPSRTRGEFIVLSTRLQNAVAGLVFIILFASAASMQLLSYFPTNSTLWYLNVNYAREARPVLELLDHLPFAGLAQNMLIVAAMVSLCVAASRSNNKILTSATTHTALYAAIFAGVASYSRTFGNLEAASLTSIDLLASTGVLDTSQLALTGLLALLLVSCLFNHYQIVSEMVRQRLFRRAL